VFGHGLPHAGMCFSHAPCGSDWRTIDLLSLYSLAHPPPLLSAGLCGPAVTHLIGPDLVTLDLSHNRLTAIGQLEAPALTTAVRAHRVRSPCKA